MRKTVKIIVILAVLAAVFWYARGAHYASQPPVEPMAEQSDVKVGGDFTLTDQNGKTVHVSDYRGRVMLVFFGFTHCPDICPVTTAILSNVMNTLGEDAQKVAPIFITVDPARDTPEVMKNYLSNFNPQMVGLTGSDEDIQKAVDAYKAYYAKPEPAEHEHVGNTHGAHNDNYLIDHSGFIYMMGKNGKYIRHFPYNVPEKELADAVKEYLAQ